MAGTIAGIALAESGPDRVGVVQPLTVEAGHLDIGWPVRVPPRCDEAIRNVAGTVERNGGFRRLEKFPAKGGKMRRSIFTSVAALALTIGAAQAQTVNKHDDPKQQSPGATGAMQNAPANGIATDPGQVQAQQGSSSKASPGTVGAAPAADTKSQGKDK